MNPEALRKLKTKLKEIKYTIIGAFVVIVLGVVGISLWLASTDKSDDYYANVNEPVKTYSLNGEIVSITGDTITIDVGQVIQTSNGNEITFVQHKVKVNNSTQLFTKGILNTATEPFATLTTGKNITVYSTENPYEIDPYLATKIEVNE